MDAPGSQAEASQRGSHLRLSALFRYQFLIAPLFMSPVYWRLHHAEVVSWARWTALTFIVPGLYVALLTTTRRGYSHFLVPMQQAATTGAMFGGLYAFTAYSPLFAYYWSSGVVEAKRALWLEAALAAPSLLLPIGFIGFYYALVGVVVSGALAVFARVVARLRR